LLAANTVPLDDGHDRVVAEGAAEDVVVLVVVEDDVVPLDTTVLFKTKPTTALLATAPLITFFM